MDSIETENEYSQMEWSMDSLEANNYSDLSELDSGVFSLPSEKSSLQNSTLSVSTSNGFESEDQSLTKISNLMREVHHQCSLVQQASRAVEACILSKQFVNSNVHIEAERILLATDLRCQLLTQQLSKAEDKATEEVNSGLKGARVQISNLEFPLKKSARKVKQETHFVIVCFTDLAIQVSPVITVEAGSQFLNYPEGFTFDHLSPESVINLRVFQLNLPSRASSWSWLNCFKPHDECARPTKNLYYKDVYTSKLRHVEVLVSMFTLVGSKSLILGECINNDTFILKPTSDSLLYGVIRMETDVSSVSTVREHFGFVALGVELRGYIVWDRKWCRLAGSELRFWDHPAEEDVNTPKLVLDLKLCMQQEVHLAKRKYCKRPRTLSLEFAAPDPSDQCGFVVRKYLMGADSMSDVHIWKTSINSVLATNELRKLFGCILDN